jgi:hypothetical protein
MKQATARTHARQQNIAPANENDKQLSMSNGYPTKQSS